MSAGAPAEEPKNWFDDPFFQVSHAIVGCPLPAGPFISEAERRVQAHSRAERGTTCWLSGACDRPSFYAYDRDIAAALTAAFAERHPYPQSTLWITVQGRVVYVEGCVADPRAAGGLEAYARTVPNVQQAVAAVYAGGRGRPPYRTRRGIPPRPSRP
jgi:hypothetical protein